MTEPSIRLEEVECVVCGNTAATVFATAKDYQYWTTEEPFFFKRCTRCGHIYLSPRPTIDSANVIYPSNYYTVAGKHTKKNSKLIAFMKKRVIRKRLAFFMEKAPERPNILEIGCGDCQLLADLRELYPKASLTGVDLLISDEIKAKAQRHGVNLIEGPFEAIKTPEGQYDLVIMNQLIEHLWNPNDAMEKIYKVLRPGGFVSIETPNTDSYDLRLFPEGKWGGFYVPRHLNLFNFETMQIFLEKHGFKVIDQQNLLAVVVWAFSFRALLKSKKNKPQNMAYRFFSDSNPLCLALFTIVDLIAKTAGLTTSNQKAIAIKKDKG